MQHFDQKLDKYADLTVKIGLNVQKGQTLVIDAPIESAEFVRKVSKKAYEAGAKEIYVEWSDEQLTRIKFEQAPAEAFLEYPLWRVKGYEELAENGAAFLTVYAPNPDLLQGIDPERIAAANKTGLKAIRNFRQYKTTFKVSWSAVSVSTEAWANKVFSESDAALRQDKLWNAIFKAARIESDNPVLAWNKHIEQLNRQRDYLNKTRFAKLHYQAKGTNLTVQLPEAHIWVSAGSHNKQGTFFVPNIPTEEVFTLPLKTGVNGTVTSTKPLNCGGNLINNFSLTFKEGRIVDFSADEGYETLKKLIETDEGSHYLGEIALVPHHSPVSDLNFVFFNTLFDENASSHLAIGMAYPFCLQGGTEMTQEELRSHECNDSLVHEDFMIGSADMSVDGITVEGRRVPIMRNGNWAEPS